MLAKNLASEAMSTLASIALLCNCIFGFDSHPRELSGFGLDLGVPSRRMWGVPCWGCKRRYFPGLLCCCRRYFSGTAMLLPLLLCCCCCFAESWGWEMRETEDGRVRGRWYLRDEEWERNRITEGCVLEREIELQRIIDWDRLLIHCFFMCLCNCGACCCLPVRQRWIATSTCWTSGTPVLCFTLNFKIWNFGFECYLSVWC